MNSRPLTPDRRLRLEVHLRKRRASVWVHCPACGGGHRVHYTWEPGTERRREEEQTAAYHNRCLPIRTCPICGKVVGKGPPPLRGDRDNLCSVECGEKWRAREAERERIEEIRSEWDRICPLAYTLTDPRRLPNPGAYQAAIEYAEAHLEDGRGLLLAGSTGTGKSRTLWQILRRCAQDRQMTIAHVRGQDFSRELVERLRPGGRGGFAEWIDSLAGADVLAIDEADKIAGSPRTSAELFSIIEARTSSMLPLIIVTNSNAAQWARALPPNIGPALIRRVRENCQAFNFDIE